MKKKLNIEVAKNLYDINKASDLIREIIDKILEKKGYNETDLLEITGYTTNIKNATKELTRMYLNEQKKG